MWSLKQWSFEHKFSPSSGASGADENNDDPKDEHEYVNTETVKKYRIQEAI